MSTIDEMLDEQLEIEENPVCYIDKATRKINVHEACKFFGVENDKRVERIKFECPQFVGDENLDLTLCTLLIAYENANGEPGLYEINDVSVVGDNVCFSWLFDEDVTMYKGNVKFIFYACLPNDDERKAAWNTTPAQGFVEEGLDVTARIEKRNSAIIEYMLTKIASLEIELGNINRRSFYAYRGTIVEDPREEMFLVNRGKIVNLGVGELRPYDLVIDETGCIYVIQGGYSGDDYSAEFYTNVKSIVSNEQVAQAVEDYFKNNPVPGGNAENGIPAGGEAGQYLCKRSNKDYDVAWVDLVIPEQYGLVSYDQDKTITIT